MNFKQYFYLFAVIVFSFSSCSEDENLENSPESKIYNIAGKVEKGPFIGGSTITIQPMNENLQVVGHVYSSTIQDNLGNFSFGSKSFEAPYAELIANGYFFNETNGQLSSSTLNLHTLVDLSDDTTVNINLFTHLKYQRIQKLIADGMEFKEANKQAQQELFTAFGLQKYVEKDASTISIADGTNESAALIAISSLLLINRDEAAFTEYLAQLSKEFGDKGFFEENTKQQINEDKQAILYRLSSIKDYLIGHYKKYGLEIEVKELVRYLDWDNDGTAGNETLQEGQEVKLEKTELNVPNEGGTYTIGISSPIPVYLNEITTENAFTNNIYENIENTDISIEKSLNEDKLILIISPLQSKTAKSTTIQICDCLDNVLGKIKIIQEGNKNASIPKLGETGKQLVTEFTSNIAQGFAELNLIEQYYHYNVETDLVNQYINVSNNTIENIWNNFYRANYIIMRFKDAEAEQLNVYQDYFNVFSAMQYYNMIVAWGDVPYINFTPDMGNYYIGRTPQNEIFTDLKNNLEKAIDYLEEKRNESLKTDANDFFFLSKDVARILLANIYMYQGEYNQAELLLKQVIDNGFYQLDASNYNSEETITDLFNNGSSKETIFATHTDIITRRDVSIHTPQVVPLMTYTDVILSYAECLYKAGKTSEAEQQLNKVTTAKNINISGNDVLEEIKEARLQLMLYTNTNFAFMKRNNFAKDTYGIDDYKLLLPIPQSELNNNPSIEQNPGY
ncbi:MAG TPA: RagB/SusD family nutrient uptake outer membrane protein [Candidatus Phocaeicola gallinarum]|nr:RagB/SusD family nutrient uptake outer membrane protein [Candidatus Phocaeicola gallinarum]